MQVTVPSLGVGYELGLAVSLGKPVLCLFRPGGERKLSAMIAGCSAITSVNFDGDVDRAIAIVRENVARWGLLQEK